MSVGNIKYKDQIMKIDDQNSPIFDSYSCIERKFLSENVELHVKVQFTPLFDIYNSSELFMLFQLLY